MNLDARKGTIGLMLLPHMMLGNALLGMFQENAFQAYRRPVHHLLLVVEWVCLSQPVCPIGGAKLCITDMAAYVTATRLV